MPHHTSPHLIIDRCNRVVGRDQNRPARPTQPTQGIGHRRHVTPAASTPARHSHRPARLEPRRADDRGRRRSGGGSCPHGPVLTSNWRHRSPSPVVVVPARTRVDLLPLSPLTHKQLGIDAGYDNAPSGETAATARYPPASRSHRARAQPCPPPHRARHGPAANRES